MSNKKATLLIVSIIFLCLIVGYIISKLTWSIVNIPFSNPDNAVGKLTLVEQNPITNSIRWAVFTVLPSTLFLSLMFIPKFKESLMGLFKNQSERNNNTRWNTIISYLTITLLVVIPIFIFLQKDLTVKYFDVFHEGVELTPAFNYIQGKGIWSGTLFVRGAFHDLFTAIFGWILFSTNSIGAYRLAVEIASLLVPISFAVFIFSIWSSFENKSKSALIVQSILFLYLFTEKIQNFDRRDAPLLIGISVLVFALNYKSRLLFFVTGLFSAICSFYSLDVGIYFTALLIFIAIAGFILKINSKDELIKYYFFQLIGFLTGWLVFYIGVKPYEFSAFWNNFTYILKYKDLLDGLAYPTPSLISSFRYTAPLLLGGFNLLILLIAYLTKYSKGLEKKQGIYT